MKELAQWAGFRFWIDAGSALLFDKLKISAEMETEEQEDQGQKYVTGKSGKPVEVSMNVILNAKLGIDVQAACMEFLEAAKTGQSGALYMAGKRLLPFEIMMTKASTEEIQIAPGGIWVAANVAVTFRQSENGTILGGVIERVVQNGGGGSGGKTAKDFADSAMDKLKQVASDVKSGAQTVNTSLLATVATIAGAAKTVSSGVTQSPAKNTTTSTASSGKKTASVSSAVASKITKKTTGLLSVKK